MFDSFLIWCLAMSLAILQTKTSIFVFPERHILRKSLYSVIRESTLCKLYQGQCWRHGNKHCETAKLNNSKINLATKPQNPVSTPYRPSFLRVCDDTICLLIFPSTYNCYCTSDLLSLHSGAWQHLVLIPESERITKRLNWGWFLVCMNNKSMMTEDTAQGRKR